MVSSRQSFVSLRLRTKQFVLTVDRQRDDEDDRVLANGPRSRLRVISAPHLNDPWEHQPMWNWIMLGLESNRVIGLRIAKLMRGGKAAQREAQRMISEKMLAA